MSCEQFAVCPNETYKDQCEDLRARHAEWTEAANGAIRIGMEAAKNLRVCEAKLEEAEKRLARYKEAIQLWGRHKDDCVCNEPHIMTDVCDCGFYDSVK